ncbi:hypothetical protein [Bacillus thuringiensis]|uniref:hypothetical protein n=1 Tax=Bacillus thuringiensis TaxID=1428 RepID=UPI000BEC5DCA|nr:hypothetical protein [Bacillus thuringiensis]EKS8366695.1 hypothetical protein [Bacillus cereus]EKS8371532.1 hypothetical protein [Bacillus cereus]MBG9497449.1 hypothetical protein [Bacillus thuringiensis]MBG9503066.1 hypothetical protein [Bacillus thuringiensis]MBG9504836.1 hypothetical protein [Bacillus thuringiensis]
MTQKSKIIAVIVALVAVLGIGSTLVFSNSKKGELEELSPQEIKKFMSQDGTGFVVYSFDKEQRDFFTNQVKKVFEKNTVSGKELNSYHPEYDGTKGQSYYGVKQRPDTLAYYQKGELKKEIPFEKYKSSDLEKELDVFVRNMKEMYIDK